jgi:hypothetical protein
MNIITKREGISHKHSALENNRAMCSKLSRQYHFESFIHRTHKSIPWTFKIICSEISLYHRRFEVDWLLNETLRNSTMSIQISMWRQRWFHAKSRTIQINTDAFRKKQISIVQKFIFQLTFTSFVSHFIDPDRYYSNAMKFKIIIINIIIITIKMTR